MFVADVSIIAKREYTVKSAKSIGFYVQNSAKAEASLSESK